MRKSVAVARAAAFGIVICGGISLTARAAPGKRDLLRRVPERSPAPASRLASRSAALLTTAQRPGSTGRDAALDQAILAGMENASIPGAIVGIWQPGNAPYVRAFGVRDRETGEPMATHLYHRIGSVTKTFTVWALLRLVDQGRVRLDDPISKYVAGVPNGHRITLRQLAAMRSGLFSYTNVVIPNLPNEPQRQWTRPELLAISFAHEPLFPPGADFDYSNTNTVLLGLVIERATGVPLETWIHRQILRRFNLTHTFFPRGAGFPNPHSQGYTPLPDGTILNSTDWNPSWGWAAGQMISTLRDMHIWTQVLGTGTLLSLSARRQRTVFLPAPDEGVGVTYGLGIENDNGWIGHNGNIPGYLTWAFYLPSRRTTMVLLLNSGVDLLGTAAMIREITRIISPNNLWPDPPPIPAMARRTWNCARSWRSG